MIMVLIKDSMVLREINRGRQEALLIEQVTHTQLVAQARLICIDRVAVVAP